MMRTLTQNTATRLAASRPDIPPERLEKKVLRTFIGSLFILVGLGLLAALVVVPVLLAWKAQDPAKLSILLVVVGLAGGLGMTVLGATVWSSELVAHPIELTVATFQGLYRTVRPGP
jgi:hypothetical protein